MLAKKSPKTGFLEERAGEGKKVNAARRSSTQSLLKGRNL